MANEPRQIFVEIVSQSDGTEQTFVDWSKGFTSYIEVIAALNAALGAVMTENQKRVQMNMRPLEKPGFVPDRGGRRN